MRRNESTLPFADCGTSVTGPFDEDMLLCLLSGHMGLRYALPNDDDRDEFVDHWDIDICRGRSES